MEGITTLFKMIFMFLVSLIAQTPLTALFMAVCVAGYYVGSRALIKRIFGKTLRELLRKDHKTDASAMHHATNEFVVRMVELIFLLLLVAGLAQLIGLRVPPFPFPKPKY